MAHAPKLSDLEIASILTSLSDWKVAEGKLHKEYRFADFVHAFSFMTAAALRIERMNHHPEWFNVYSTVRVDLTTHDSGGISQKDVDLARVLDELAAKLQ
ncbi:MAG: 4a-hydroxytetrahydrobiopterin dehydratase [Bryobacterales bacterium]|nr:4a-hydroxytetrahydrobiopterin dehydratase [Bryobacterales bacterium]